MAFILSYLPARRALRSCDTMLRSGKRVSCPQVDHFAGSSATPQPPSAKKQRSTQHPDDELSLLDFPEDVLEGLVVSALDFRDLCALAQACKPLRKLAVSDGHWQRLVEQRWGPSTELLTSSAKIAGSWRALYREKHECERANAPWQKLSASELQAAVGRMHGDQRAHSASSSVVMFLVDGSGSVTEEDFRVMTEFILQAALQLVAADPSVQVGVLQFSNDVRVEVAPQAVDGAKFTEAVTTMARMNGGTNIACSVQRAGQLLKHLPSNSMRTLCFLTDGRVDDYQAREAAEMASRLADEQGPVAMYAFGVGRGVDKQELLRIVGATQPAAAADRYFDLCVRDEAPW